MLGVPLSKFLKDALGVPGDAYNDDAFSKCLAVKAKIIECFNPDSGPLCMCTKEGLVLYLGNASKVIIDGSFTLQNWINLSATYSQAGSDNVQRKKLLQRVSTVAHRSLWAMTGCLQEKATELMLRLSTSQCEIAPVIAGYYADRLLQLLTYGTKEHLRLHVVEQQTVWWPPVPGGFPVPGDAVRKLYQLEPGEKCLQLSSIVLGSMESDFSTSDDPHHFDEENEVAVTLITAGEETQGSVVSVPVEKAMKMAKIPLSEAKHLGQAVKGTSAGSTYYMVGSGAGVKVAARYRGYQLSIRAEGPGAAGAASDILKKSSGFHYSTHFHIADQKLALKTLGAVLFAMCLERAIVDATPIVGKT